MDIIFINREHSRSLSGCVFLKFHWQEDSEWAAATMMVEKGVVANIASTDTSANARVSEPVATKTAIEGPHLDCRIYLQAL